MNLLVRADSSGQIGLGHIMRDLVFVKRYPDAQITFACRNLAGSIIDKIPYPVHILSSDDSEELIEYIVSHTIDTVLFDHYGIDAAYEKQIKEQTGVIVISMDDTYQPHHCDILYNPNVYASEQRYHALVPTQCNLQCGQPLIREEFALTKCRPKPKTNFIFLSMGGSDPLNLSLKILDLLPAQTPVHLVTTSSNPHLATLRRSTNEHPNIRLHINASNIAELMHESSFAIITPSTIAHEAMFMELPFIAIQSADNQHEFVEYMRQKGFNVLEHFDKNAFKTILERLL